MNGRRTVVIVYFILDLEGEYYFKFCDGEIRGVFWLRDSPVFLAFLEGCK